MRKLVALAGLLVFVSSSYAALRVTPAPSFARPKSFATGRLPESIAIGDLNGDARPDLVTANDLAQSVSVLLNRGDGGFHVKADYRTGVLPRSVAIGDLNSDGKPDLATANQTGSVSLLVNRGDGTFGRQTELRLAAAAVAIGDLNSDGKADLAVAGGYHVSVLLNGGGGTFQPPLAYQTGSDPSSVAIGDLNGDGRPDLATANWEDDTISVLLNRGDGSFQPKHDYGAGIHPNSVAIGDLNGDSKPDVVAANGGTKEVTVFLNRGQGTLRLGGEYATGGFALSAAIGDLNGDGKPDVAATTYPANRIAVLVNRGSGRFQPRLEFGTGHRLFALAIGDLNARRPAGSGNCKRQQHRLCLHRLTRALHGAGRRGKEVADRETSDRARQLPRREDPPRLLEGQAWPCDLAEAEVRRGAAGREQGRPRRQPWKEALVRRLLALSSLLIFAGAVGASALPSASAPSFARARSYATGRTPYSVGIGDLNGDGRSDLVTANLRANTISVLLNRGDGSFRAKLTYATGAFPQAVAIGDLNGDGKPDLVTAGGGIGNGNTVSVLLNRGDGTFGDTADYPTGNNATSVAIGDLNGDGKPDLAIANFGYGTGNTVSVLLNRGDGSFEPRRDYTISDGPISVAIADLNRDGKLDLATANPGGTVSVLLNTSEGSFQAIDYETGVAPASVAIGDLNGDGKPDLATANRSGTVSVLLNRGDGSFRGKRDYATGAFALTNSVAIGDLNGDGKPDLATANQDADAISVLLNRGDGSFRAKLGYATGHAPVSIAIGDLNGDGRADLATADSGAKTVSVLLNTPGLCAVQYVEGKTLPAAKRTLSRANCRVGTIRRAYSKRPRPGSPSRWVKRGRVISQKPYFGAVRPGGSKVDLVVSRGRRTS